MLSFNTKKYILERIYSQDIKHTSHVSLAAPNITSSPSSTAADVQHLRGQEFNAILWNVVIRDAKDFKANARYIPKIYRPTSAPQTILMDAMFDIICAQLEQSNPTISSLLTNINNADHELSQQCGGEFFFINLLHLFVLRLILSFLKNFFSN